MLGRCDDDKTIARHRDKRQRGVVDGPLGEAEVSRAIKNSRRDVGGIAFVKCHSDRRMRGLEAHKERRKPIASNGLTGLNCQRATLKPAEFDQVTGPFATLHDPVARVVPGDGVLKPMLCRRRPFGREPERLQLLP